LTTLVLNAGSSTLKASLIEPGADAPRATVTETWAVTGEGRQDVEASFERAIDRVGVETAAVGGVGHRVVHGGDSFRAPVVLDDRTVAALDKLGPLAPLHNPIAVATIRVALSRLHDVRHVACFDTAFHASLPETAWRYPVPDSWLDWGIRRYGFHGLSVEWSVGRAAALLESPVSRLRLVVAHLGAGCSVTAVDRGHSVWTSMGLTPLEGPMMATRAGSIDPGALVRLLRDGRVTLDDLDETLERGSGLLAVGGSGDMRELLEREAAGDDRASLAIAMFVDRAAAAIASAMTRLSTLDGLVVTGGIGENAATIRARICRRLRSTGIPAIPSREVRLDGILSHGDWPAVLRIAAREDVVIARAVERLASARAGDPAVRARRTRGAR
jgi:acetate kinase